MDTPAGACPLSNKSTLLVCDLLLHCVFGDLYYEAEKREKRKLKSICHLNVCCLDTGTNEEARGSHV